jgi:hypothetical protein
MFALGVVVGAGVAVGLGAMVGCGVFVSDAVGFAEGAWIGVWQSSG